MEFVTPTAVGFAHDDGLEQLDDATTWQSPHATHAAAALGVPASHFLGSASMAHQYAQPETGKAYVAPGSGGNGKPPKIPVTHPGQKGSGGSGSPSGSPTPGNSGGGSTPYPPSPTILDVGNLPGIGRAPTTAVPDLLNQLPTPSATAATPSSGSDTWLYGLGALVVIGGYLWWKRTHNKATGAPATGPTGVPKIAPPAPVGA